jgi:hypothetical protein
MSPDELVELEERGWRALADGPQAAAAFYEQSLADEVVMLFPGGIRMADRAAIIASMGGPPWAGYELEDPQVLQPTPGHRSGDLRRGGAPRGQPALLGTDQQPVRAARGRLEARLPPADAPLTASSGDRHPAIEVPARRRQAGGRCATLAAMPTRWISRSSSERRNAGPPDRPSTTAPPASP